METLEYTWEMTVSNSSSIAHVYYNDNNARMYIQFVNKSLAGYKNVEAWVPVRLANAGSPGSYYNKHIRGIYAGVSTTGTLVRVGHDPFVPAPSKNTRTYTVRGYVLTEETYEASTPEQAVELFQADYDGATVKEVVVSFE